MKTDIHIQIVSSAIPGLSSMGRGLREVAQAILARHYTKVGITIVNDIDDLEALVALRPDLVFLGMKFISHDPALGVNDPEKIWVGEYLDKHGIPYTGSGSGAHNLEFDKPQAKQRVLEMGLATSPYLVAGRGHPALTEDMIASYPLFVKPTNRGGGLGVDSNSVVHNFDELQSKIYSIVSELQSDVLIEEYLYGREFSVAILKDRYTAEFLVMPIELVAEQNDEGARILSSEIKSSNTEVVLPVSDLPLRAKICSLGLDVFRALGARDYGRIDIRLDGEGEAHFLEANLLPSLASGYGSFPKACEINLSLNHESMMLTIVQLALARTAEEVNDLEPSFAATIYPLTPVLEV